jgi:sugar-specific transcriptional regulator TrmB
MELNSQITTVLTDLGLSENDATLYQILLKTQDATIPVLTKKSPFSRTMLYHILKSLEEYELITSRKMGSKTVYDAVSPGRLEEFIRDQERAIKEQKELLGGVMTQLRADYVMNYHKPGVQVFEGVDGIMEALDDTLTAESEILTFVDSASIVLHEDIKRANEAYVKKRLKQEVPKRLLIPHSPENIARWRTREQTALTQFKILPPSMRPFHTGVNIYNNKVAYFTLREEYQIGILIDDESIAETNRALFEFAWSQGNVPT